MASRMFRIARVVLGLLLGLGSAAGVFAQVPDVVSCRILAPKGGPRLGEVFRLEMEVRTTATVRWQIPDTPLDVGDFTLDGVSVSPSEPPGDTGRLILAIQCFRLGEQPLPVFPIQWRDGDGPFRQLVYSPGRVTVRSQIQAAGQAHPAPRPPRTALTLGGERKVSWLVAGIFLAVLILAGWWVRRRRRRPATVKDLPAAVAPPDLAQFLSRLDELWALREKSLSQRLLAAGMMDVFREYLSWRFEEDLRAHTPVEIEHFLAERISPEGKVVEQTVRVMRLGSEACFAPAGGAGHALLQEIKRVMELIGGRPEGEEAFAVAEKS